MIGDVAPLVERLLKAEDAAGGRLNLLLVAGAGTTIATCWGLGHGAISSWPGLIAGALEHAASKARVGDEAEREALRAQARLCKDAKTADALLDLCDAARDVFDRTDLDLSQWIFDSLTGLEEELEARLKADVAGAPLLGAIRDWQSALGALVATTNYDRLLSVAHCGDPIELDEEPLRSNPQRALGELIAGARNVIHLHGRYDRDDSAVFSRDQYKRLMRLNLEQGSFARSLFDATLPVFIGCGAGIGDEDLRSLIAERSCAGAEVLKRAVVLCLEDDPALPDMTQPPFDTRCVRISYGTEFGDLVPFLEAVRRELGARGFRGRRGRKGTLRAEGWLKRRRDARLEAGARMPLPPIELDGQAREIRLRKFYGTLLRPRAPNYEFQAVEPWGEAPDASTALHEDARFDPVPLSALDDATLAVVLGNGGSGKTSLTHLLVSRALKAPGAILPIHIRVADYFRARERRLDGDLDGSADLWDHLIRELQRPEASDPLVPPPYAELDDALGAAASEGRVLVILDGVDEVSRLTDRSAIVSEAVRLHDRLQSAGSPEPGQRNRLVLTSRYAGYRASPVVHPAAQHFALCPLVPEQVDLLHDGFFVGLLVAGVAGRETLVGHRRALRKALASGPHSTTAWIDTPLMAMLVAVVFLADRRLPGTREELYRRIVEQGCAFVLDRAPPLQRPLAPRELRAVLGEAAYRIFTRGTQDALSRTALRDAFALHRPREGEAGLDALVDVATSDRSLLRERGPEYFAFVHRGILEYLCGSRLSHDVAELAARAAEPEWREPASFAAGMALQNADVGALSRSIVAECSIANGARPLACLLRGGTYAARLPTIARQALAATTIEILGALAPHIGSLESHPALRALLQDLGRQRQVARSFDEAIRGSLADPDAPGHSLLGALLACEGLGSGTAGTIQAIDAALKDADFRAAWIGEKVQRELVRKAARRPMRRGTAALLPFGDALAGTAVPSGDLAEWRRVLAALCGGIPDLGHAGLRQVRSVLVKFLASDDVRRNILLFTLAEHLRALGFAQQDLIAEQAAGREGRRLSQREARRELQKRPDLVLGIALYLDKVAEPALTDTTVPASFDPRLVHRTPRLADAILQAFEAGQPASAFAQMRKNHALAPEECAVVQAIAGGDPIVPGHVDALRLASERLADGAVRSLLAVEAALVRSGGSELFSIGLILSDAVLDLKLHFGLFARFETGQGSGRAEYDNWNFRETVARTLAGANDSAEDDIYNAMVMLDVLNATKRIGGLLELGHSRIIANGRTTWDLPPLPLPHFHNEEQAILGEAIDILEACPSSISALRSDTLKGLRERSDPPVGDAVLEIDAALARDWGAQAGYDEESRLDADDWGDRAAEALARARAAEPSVWKARALARLLRFAAADDRDSREREIVAEIGRIADPFGKLLALELLAERGSPAKGQVHAIAAFDLLWSAAPFPTGLFRRRGPPAFASPERCARAYARLSVWLPRRQRERALEAAAGFACQIANPWARTLLLQALAPYARHTPAARKSWDRGVSGLPSFQRAFARGDTGEVLRGLVDEFLYDAEGLCAGEADPIVAYALLRDSLRRAGEGLEAWETLERAQISQEGAEAVRRAYAGNAVPRLSSAGLLSLRAFSEAGMADVARFVISRVPRHPPGAAALVHETEPALAQLIRAATHGIDACSAAAAVDALGGADENCRAIAVATLEPPRPVQYKDPDEALRQRAFTLRRASAEGIETLMALARAASSPDRRAGHVQHARWFAENVLLETRGQAALLASAAREGGDMEAARWLLRRACPATPQFVQALLGAIDPDEPIAPLGLRLVAGALHRAPFLAAKLGTDGTLDVAWRWLRARPGLRQGIRSGNAERAAHFFLGATRLDPADMDAAFDRQFACVIAKRRDVVPALSEWAASFFARDRLEGDPVLQAAAAIVARDERALATLVSYCTWDAREAVPDPLGKGPGLHAFAWPLLAACAELCPVTLQSRMLAGAMFELLPTTAIHNLSWVTRRSAFQLMPLEWQARPARVNLDVLQAALAASEDIWQVQEAALATVAAVRAIDNGALDLLYDAAGQGGSKALMAFRIIIAILNNDRAPHAVRRHARLLVERALGSQLGDLLIEHGVATSNAPPRMRLREVLLNQVFSEN